MLGSDADGERATAGRMAHELLRAAGLTWGDVLTPGPVVIPPPPPPTYRPAGRRLWEEPVDHSHAAAVCLGFAEYLNGKERAFLLNIATRWRLSPKQEAWLWRIVAKVRRLVGAAYAS